MDSASGNLKLARDNDYQAVLPIRGKLLNVRKANNPNSNAVTKNTNKIDSNWNIKNIEENVSPVKTVYPIYIPFAAVGLKEWILAVNQIHNIICNKKIITYIEELNNAFIIAGECNTTYPLLKVINSPKNNQKNTLL